MDKPLHTNTTEITITSIHEAIILLTNNTLILGSRLTKVEADIIDIRADIIDIRADIVQIKADIIDIRADIIDIREEMATMRRDMAIMKSDIQEIKLICRQNSEDIDRLVRMFGEHFQNHEVRITNLELKCA